MKLNLTLVWYKCFAHSKEMTVVCFQNLSNVLKIFQKYVPISSSIEVLKFLSSCGESISRQQEVCKMALKSVGIDFKCSHSQLTVIPNKTIKMRSNLPLTAAATCLSPACLF
jgi:hypothetical protein